MKTMNLHHRIAWFGRRAVAVLLCLAFVTSCEDTQAPAPTPDDGTFGGHYDPIAGKIEFELRTPDGSASSLRLLATNLRYDDATQELAADVVLRNVGANAVQGPSLVLLGDFDPSSVEPRNAQPMACPACIGCPCWPWAYDYSQTFGDDGTLEPGESSAAVEWILYVPGRVSFSFQALLDAQHVPPPGTISGAVFQDQNHDGRRDPSEPGIAGVIVFLDHDDASQTATTGADGRFAFAVSEPGLYVVRRDATDACVPTTPLERQVVIVQRQDGSLSGYDRADFGCASRNDGSIPVRGAVFNDLNRNGWRDPGEPGLQGVQITGSANNCPTLALFVPIFAHTGPDGEYQLVLPPCAPPYVIARDEIPGFVGTSPNPLVFGAGSGNDPTPLPMRLPLIANFGVAVADSDSTRSAAIVGTVFRDTNSNGHRDPDEAGVPDHLVTAGGLLCGAPSIAVRTDANGDYRFERGTIPCPLPWTVSHEDVVGSCSTTPSPVVLHLPVPPGGVYRVDFGIDTCNEPPPFGITGVVWFDANRNGTRERDEGGIAGAVVMLGSPCDVVIEAVTDETGRYVFAPQSIPCPIYSAMQVRPEFAVHTTPNPHPIRPNSVPPGAMLSIDFGVFERR